jgi:hypothetical protein
MDMLAHDPLAEQFVGGTVYQAFLSALSYHRWHAPVSGKIVKANVVNGTYYSEPMFQGFAESEHPDATGEGASQAYLTEVATRCFIYIQADNPKIGLMCVMPVGMVEVSTCDITVKEGQHVKKGDQLGMVSFEFVAVVLEHLVADSRLTVPFRRLHALPLLPQRRYGGGITGAGQGGERASAQPGMHSEMSSLSISMANRGRKTGGKSAWGHIQVGEQKLVIYQNKFFAALHLFHANGVSHACSNAPSHPNALQCC